MPVILCPFAEVSADGKEVIFESSGKRYYLMLFLHAGDVVGYHNVCPHMGRNLNLAPDRFLFDPARRLVCPHHGALFDVVDGACVQGPCQGDSLRPLKLCVEDGNVLLMDNLAI